MNYQEKLLLSTKILSTKGLTKDMVNKYRILNGAKYFSSGVLQNYIVFISASKSIELFIGSQPIINGNLKEYLKNFLKIRLHQTIVLLKF